MFFNAKLKPTKTKHTIYLISATVLGVLLSVLAHVFIETMYLRWAENAHHAVRWYGGCSLHPIIQIALVVFGALSGFAVGRIWWRFVYIDRRWAKRFSGPKQDLSKK